MDDVSKRVFELARGCIDELEKQKQYIRLLEEYIEELENGVEMPTTKPVQLEQPMEMEKSDDNMDYGRPSAVRRRTTKSSKGTTGSGSQNTDGISNGDGGNASPETSINFLDK